MLERVVGPDLAQPLRERDRMVREANDLVANLLAHRPGGDRWKDALGQDRDDYLAGKSPKRWHTETLLAEDPHRWAEASVVCRTLTERVKAVMDTLDLPAIASTARTVMIDHEGDWALATMEAWKAREEKAPRGQQVLSYEKAAAALTEWAVAAQVWRGSRGNVKPRNQDEADALVAVRHGFPGGSIGRAWWTLRHEQDGSRPVTIPPHIAEKTEVRLTPDGRVQDALAKSGASW